MTIEEIKELISLVNDTGIAELEVTRGENRVRIRRANPPVPQDYVIPAAHHVVAPIAAAPQAAPPAASPQALSMPAAPSGPIPDENTVYVKSPIVGTYYESPSPDLPPFIKVGDRVSAGQVLCIIESMKLMNEIESEVSGIIISKLVDNGRPVEYGEALFAIQPS
jgi:acetyl-CoA carboxylase biotin carboxyl carrier protein